MGRKSKYRNAAEKQKAYRERKKQQEQENAIVLTVMADLQEAEVTLRKAIEYWQSQGRRVELARATSFHKHRVTGKLMVGGLWRDNIDTMLMCYLELKGELIQTRKTSSETYYQLIDVDDSLF